MVLVAIRLYAEYLHGGGRTAEISFRSLSGDAIGYALWLRGTYALAANGARIDYRPGRQCADAPEAFERYLHFVMQYANSASLARDLAGVAEVDLAPGDLYLQPDPRGGVGHASVLLRVCRNRAGERLYLFGYGFIPAQDFHLPRPAAGEGRDGWFTLDGFRRHVAAFGEGRFQRFP